MGKHYDHEAAKARSKEHLIRPQPGDYWHEMFTPIRIVVWTDGEFIEFADSQTQVMLHEGERCWDTDKPPPAPRSKSFAHTCSMETATRIRGLTSSLIATAISFPFGSKPRERQLREEYLLSAAWPKFG